MQQDYFSNTELFIAIEPSENVLQNVMASSLLADLAFVNFLF